MESNFAHKPVMMAEVLEALMPRAGGRYADGTLGGAGHGAAILAASSPDGWLSGCDRDGVAIDAATRRLAEFAGRFEIRQGNFAGFAEWRRVVFIWRWPFASPGLVFKRGIL